MFEMLDNLRNRVQILSKVQDYLCFAFPRINEHIYETVIGKLEFNLYHL